MASSDVWCLCENSHMKLKKITSFKSSKDVQYNSTERLTQIHEQSDLKDISSPCQIYLNTG